MYSLIFNEVTKMVLKKRLYVVLGILVVLISLFAYGEHYTAQKSQEQLVKQSGEAAAGDWRKQTQLQITDLKRRMDNPFVPEAGKSSIRVRAEQLQYYLDKDINPLESTAGRFTSRFIAQAIALFIPLMMILLAGDMVSGELAGGNIKMLLTRPVERWRVLVSKHLTLLLMEGLVLLLTALLSVLIAWIVFRRGGWDAPVLTGFQVHNGQLDASHVRSVTQLQYVVMSYGLAWLVSVSVGALALMVSVIVRSTSAAIGVMMSALIAGSFLAFFISDWKLARYLFNVNLSLTDYLSGSFQPIDGLSLIFSVAVLGAWTLGAVVVSFLVFVYRDVTA